MPKKTSDKPSNLEIVRAATNAPELSSREVQLGDRKFKVVDLPYDDYVEFTAYLQPLFESLISKLAQSKGLPLASQEISASSLFQYCSKNLPEMVRLCLKQTEPDITVGEIKLILNTPFKMVSVVLTQIEQNQVITEMASFFAQITPILRAGFGLMK